MRNLDQLKTGGKPAPGKLIVVQGFINTADVEEATDLLATPGQMRSWLLRHGLISPGTDISSADFEKVRSLREALRELLLANNGEAVRPTTLRQLNRLLPEYPLTVTCAADGTPELGSSGTGIARAVGLILSQVIKAVNEGTWSRLKACSDPECRWAFYDGSKNRSGRWCSMAVCGSRDKARSYRRRQSAK